MDCDRDYGPVTLFSPLNGLADSKDGGGDHPWDEKGTLACPPYRDGSKSQFVRHIFFGDEWCFEVVGPKATARRVIWPASEHTHPEVAMDFILYYWSIMIYLQLPQLVLRPPRIAGCAIFGTSIGSFFF